MADPAVGICTKAISEFGQVLIDFLLRLIEVVKTIF
jgi:hypothetical protein